MDDLLRLCHEYATLVGRPEREFTNIVSAWDIHYSLLPETGEPVERNFVLLKTANFGACHAEEVIKPDISSKILGRDCLALEDLPIPYQIAGMDAAASTAGENVFREHLISGDGAKLERLRADLICKTAFQQIGQIRAIAHRRFNVTVVGALGSIIRTLSADLSLNVRAVDKNIKVIGKRFGDVVVHGPEQLMDFVSTSDIVVMTGMALVNGGAQQVIANCKDIGARVVMYMQTGANLARPILDYGASAVVSEPYPFYYMGVGHAKIRVFRP